ncbi:MAG: tRNA (N6-isopentenyl adenosine(37)-C2)-methylthiotransferase MiaB [Clostridiales bacterium]|nr:tRNA (N6-isopentenyl adenosine(37)-C2)-methylthiotransferase MiaB [Clostridiales bacterium]
MSNRKTVDISKEEIQEQKEYIDNIKELIKGRSLKYHIITYGCQMNIHDSEKLAGMLNSMGYTETSDQAEADLILFNTCCVRENAEHRVYGNVGALYLNKQQNPNLIIGICGCMMQQRDVSDYITKKFPFVDLIFGTHNLHRFPKLLLEAMDSRQTVVEVLDEEGRIVENVPIIRNLGVTAWTTIMYGCDNFCSYCIVPYVRGRERSRQPSDILDEINQLAEEGYKEVTLLGQNVNSYGKDFNEPYYFSNLLRYIDRVDGIERIRFMTSHPKDLSKDLILAMAESEKVCEHLHLPIQSGSNRILKQMNRGYSRENYLELVNEIRHQIPNIAITTDIIVGFPGETEEDFADTLDMVEKVRYDSAFTFIYSQRTGTPAAKMSKQIDENIKKERLQKLMDVQGKISKEINDKAHDTIVDVLVEGLSKKRDDMYTGRTPQNKLVNFAADHNTIGNIVKVKITQPKTWTLEGIMI